MPFRRPIFQRDRNHASIARALEKAGAFVVDLAGVGGGVADLFVFHRNAPAPGWCFMEVKNPTRDGERKGGKAIAYTPAEKAWLAAAVKYGVPVAVVTSLESALTALGLMSVKIGRAS